MTNSIDSSIETFASFVRILGRGKTGSRSLNFDEAYQAFSLILQGKASGEQVGAFLMLLRVKEESAEEIAGFAKACQDFINAPALDADIDWPSYAGKRKQPPWFILCLLLLAHHGKRIFVHGSMGYTANRLYTEAAFAALGLPIVHNWQQAQTALAEHKLCYMPLPDMCQPLQQLIDLRSHFGLRSAVHTLCRLINPSQAPFLFSSIFHPAYAATHQQAAVLLNQPNMAVFKGESGEVERKADATCLVKSVQFDNSSEYKWPRLQQTKQAPVETLTVQALKNCWQQPEQEPYGEQAVIGTLAIVLAHLEQLAPEQAMSQATTMWQQRPINHTIFQ